MSDRLEPPNDDNPWARPSTPAPESGGHDPGPLGGFPDGPPLVEPPLTLGTETEVTSTGGKGGRVVAGIIGVVALVAGSVFAFTQLASSGPASPEQAVEELLEAVSNEDVLGMLAALDPAERDALRGPVEDMVTELQRMEVLGDAFDLSSVAGIDYEFSDVTYRTADVRDGLARVHLTGGTVTYDVDGTDLPVGEFVRDTIERFDGAVSDLDESDTDQIADEDVFLAARETGDGWRVSIGYTLAELARMDAGQPVPTGGVAPIGADSPEAAVEGLLTAASELDLSGAIARLSPDEFGPLQEYAPMFLAEAEEGIAEAEEIVDLRFGDLTLRAEESGDRAMVFIDDMEFVLDVSFPIDDFYGDDYYFDDEFDDEPPEDFGFTVEYRDSCLTVSGNRELLGLMGVPGGDPLCGDDLEELGTGMFGGLGFGGLALADDIFGDIEIPEIDPPALGIATARVDGEWYVAPVATGLDALVQVARVLDRSHLDAFVDMAEAFTTGFEESFEDVGDRIGEYEGEIGEIPFDDLPFEDVPVPTTDLGEQFPDIDWYALYELVDEAAAGDVAVADCVMGELELVDPSLLHELADSYLYDYEPSSEALDPFIAAFQHCTSG